MLSIFQYRVSQGNQSDMFLNTCEVPDLINPCAVGEVSSLIRNQKPVLSESANMMCFTIGVKYFFFCFVSNGGFDKYGFGRIALKMLRLQSIDEVTYDDFF